jgi:hypothetical protein
MTSPGSQQTVQHLIETVPLEVGDHRAQRHQVSVGI